MRMQLDGPDLEALLVRARHEYGPAVRIVNADKVRSGGVGGFFTREHYELTIELDDADDASHAAPSVSRPASLFADPPSVPMTVPTTVPMPSASTDHRPISILDLADAISDREILDSQPSVAPSAPTVSTDGASFASMLAGLTESVGEQPVSPGLPARPATHTTTPVIYAHEADHEPFIAARPPMAEASFRRVSRKPARRTSTEISVRALRDLGVPGALLPANHSGDLLSALVEALRALPPLPQPPACAGDIFAVVGEGEAAWDAALQLAISMGLDERAVMLFTRGNPPVRVAPTRRVASLDQLVARVERWRKRPTPTIVVIDAPMNPKAADANCEALEVLDATAVWLVVPATRKTRDVADWANRLRRADALVVTDVDASNDPASVLQLGIPVAWLDGRPATPGTWAGLIVERLVAAA
jgi:hypothetical protein